YWLDLLSPVSLEKLRCQDRPRGLQQTMPCVSRNPQAAVHLSAQESAWTARSASCVVRADHGLTRVRTVVHTLSLTDFHVQTAFATQPSHRDAVENRSVNSLDRHAEDVTRVALGADIARFRRIQLELTPQPHDLHIDRSVVYVVTVKARHIEQLI